MEKYLPADIWRVEILPFLDWSSRVEVNQVLNDPNSKIIKRRDEKKDWETARAITLERVYQIMDDVNGSRNSKERVKALTRLFRYLQHPYGQVILKTPRFSLTAMSKMNELEAQHPPIWWSRSPYRKTLRKEMNGLREMILGNDYMV